MSGGKRRKHDAGVVVVAAQLRQIDVNLREPGALADAFSKRLHLGYRLQDLGTDRPQLTPRLVQDLDTAM